MRTIEWTGSLLALSSIAHAGKESGTTHGFRREVLILPNGKRLAGVPVISGGVVRGGMRRMAAIMAQEAIVGSDGRLPFTVVHALRTGGALRETRAAEEVLTGERQAVLRDLIPMLGVFGFSTSGRIVTGRLEVDKPLPIARETMYLLDHYGVTTPDDYTPPSIWELIQQEQYSRFADVNDAAAQPYIDQNPDVPRELPKGSGNMLWSQETLSPGTRLFHRVRLTEGTPVEVSFMDELMRRWSQRGRVGAQRGRGMGQVRFDYTRHCLNVLGDPTTDEPTTDWRQHTQEHLPEIKEALRWL